MACWVPPSSRHQHLPGAPGAVLGAEGCQEPPSPPRLSCDVFFDFSRDIRNGMLCFGTTLGRPLSEKWFKSRCFARGCPEKVKKTLRRSASEAKFEGQLRTESPSGIHPRNPRNPRIRCHQLPKQTSLPHAPGVRMTDVS